MEKNLKWTNLVAAALILILMVLIGRINWGYSFDDAFITYRYARNLSRGEGFVYNPGERHLGTTTPLYALLLALFGLFYPDIPFWGFLLSFLSLGLTAFFTYLLLSRCVHPAAGLISIPLLLLNRPLLLSLGNESNLLLLLLVSQYYFYVTGRLKTFGFLAGLGVLTRGEGIILPAVIFLFELGKWSKGNKPDLAPWIIIAAIAAPWFIFSKVYFGTFLPATLKIKMLLTKNPLYAHPGTFFQDNFVKIWLEYCPHILCRLVLVAIFIYGLARSFLDRKFIPLTLGFVAFLAGYSLLNVYGFHWYRAQTALILALFLSGGIFHVSLAVGTLAGGRGDHSILRRLKGALWPDRQTGLSGGVSVTVSSAAVMAALAVFFSLKLTTHSVRVCDDRREIYTEAGRWLERNTDPKASVLLPEIGFVGYYAGRKIIDPVGLVSPRMGTLQAQLNWDYIVETCQPDFIVDQPKSPPEEIRPGMIHPLFRGNDFRYVLVESLGHPVQVLIWKREEAKR